jgi:lysophospholipid acyltransferase (LPLAT)-like uncharacterized protein
VISFLQMEIDETRAFRPAPLDQYSFRHRLLIYLIDLVVSTSIWLLGVTTRYDVKNPEHLESIELANRQPIFAYWHDSVVTATYFFRGRKIVSMVSQSLEGDAVARITQHFGNGAVRGSSTRGGSEALLEMARLSQSGFPTAFSVDGPRGPRYKAKIGPLILAQRTGNPVLPTRVEVLRSWTLNSWDRLQIPYPFSPTRITFGEPIYVKRDADDKELEEKLVDLQRSLDLLSAGHKVR